MFDHKSRYNGLTDLSYESPDGRQITYRERRLVPRVQERPVIAEIEVAQGDRPDLLAARALQDSSLYWQLCDANDVMHPRELLGRAKVRVLLPGIR